MSSREVSLSGGEIAVIKALGTSGSAVAGDTLVERMNNLEDAEIIDTLLGLMAQDYVESDRDTFRSIEDVNRATFKTNAQHIKELRAALSPQRKEREKRGAARSRGGGPLPFGVRPPDALGSALVTMPPTRRRRPLSPAAQVALALGGSVLLNLLLAAVVAVAVQLWPAAPLTTSGPISLDVVREPEPEPELTASSTAPRPTPPPFLRTEERQRQDKPPDDAFFQSDKDTANASEQPPTGDLPLPSQDGRKLPMVEFDTREYVAGDKAADDARPGPTAAPPAVAQAQPAPTPRAVDPPRPQVNREAPRPTPAPTPVAVATPTPAPTPLPPRPEANEFAMRAPTPPPELRATEPPRPRPAVDSLDVARPRPQPPTPPVAHPGSPGYRPQTVQTKMEGGLTTRGPSSIAARDTPLGRYQKAMSDAIGSRWYFGMQQNSDTVQAGTVKVRFYIDPSGHVRRPEVIQGTSGSTLATVSITAVIEANLPPMPPEIAAALPSNQMEVDFTFSSL